MRPWDQPVALPLPTLPRPTALQREGEPTGRLLASEMPPDQRVKARQLLRRLIAGSDHVPTLRECRGLLTLVGESETTTRERLAGFVLRNRSLPLGPLRELWEDCPEARAAVAARIAERIERASDATRALLPWWIPPAAAEARLALEHPGPACAREVHARPLAIQDLAARLDVLPTSPLGVELLELLFDTAPPGWWKGLGPAEEVRAWAQGHGGDAAPRIVADRQLRAFGEGAATPYDLPDAPEAQSLLTWVTKTLGDPAEHPGRWARVSDRAREVFEWIHIKDALGKILAEFAAAAGQEDRAAFWVKQARSISDARFHRTRDSAVCLMRIGGAMFIEFGTLGNALYVYGVGDGSPPMRLWKGLPSVAGDYKATGITQVRIASQTFHLRDRLTHQPGWQYKAAALIRRASAVADSDATIREDATQSWRFW